MSISDKKTNETKNKKKQKKRKNTSAFYSVMSFILIIITVITIGLIIYNGIFSFKTMTTIIISSILIIGGITYILNKKGLKNWIKKVITILSILIIIFEFLMAFHGTSTLKFLENIIDTGYRVESYGVYVLKTSSVKNISELKDKNITYLNESDDTNVRNVISKIKKEISFEEDYLDSIDELLDELISQNTDAILVPLTYESIIDDEFKEKGEKIKFITSYDLVLNVDTIESDTDITKDPFVVYISGIDTSGSVQSKARSDVNILLAVNPKTKNILMINTPRDYYVTLHTSNKKDKLTHAGIYGVEESLLSLEDLYNTDIDYYVRINFTSFVSIVNNLGGIKVNVPLSFCSQNSHRSKADKDKVCLTKGLHTLNGEQALALARNRKSFKGGDRARGENQMMILEAIINKAMSPSIITKYSQLVASLNNKVSTNMTSNEIYRFAKKQIKGANSWKFSSISATGKDSSNICYSTGAGKAYVMEPDVESLEKIKTSLKDLMTGTSSNQNEEMQN